MTIDLDGIYSPGGVPFQMMYALQGNINASGKRFSYRTLRIGEYFGDRVFSLKIQQDLGDELFRLSGIPILKDSQLQLGIHLNMALLDISEKSRKILNRPYKTFKYPFYEAGFSIGHILFPLRLEFTWKLNHIDGNNFEWGVNAFIL